MQEFIYPEVGEAQDFIFKSNWDHTSLSFHFMWSTEFFKKWPNKKANLQHSQNEFKAKGDYLLYISHKNFILENNTPQ